MARAFNPERLGSFLPGLWLWMGLLAGLPVPVKVHAQAGTVETNDIEIAYESFGKVSDEAIIMIQGTGATMLHYPAEMCRKLADEGYRVIRFDNRDVGSQYCSRGPVMHY